MQKQLFDLPEEPEERTTPGPESPGDDGAPPPTNDEITSEDPSPSPELEKAEKEGPPDTPQPPGPAEQGPAAGYTSADIQVLEGLEAVRVRPGMYIGSTDQRGLHHLIYEIMDNSVDEAMAGYCNQVDVSIHQRGQVTVADNGRGIPVDTHPTTGRSALETVMTTLHAGGKFGSGAYKVSGGLHGVGASVVNALSARLRAQVQRDGHTHIQDYRRGVPTGDLTPGRRTRQHGTTISFRPDPRIFPKIDYDFETLADHFKQIAYLNQGLEINFISHWHEEQRLGDINRKRTPIHHTPFHHAGAVGNNTVEVALQYNNGYNESVLSFANCINTQEGGTHLTGFRTALTRAVNDHARKSGLLKEDQPNLAGEDTREGLAAVISVKLANPQFEGQTKTKLGNAEVASIVQQVAGEGLARFLEDQQAEARRIVEECLTAQRARAAAWRAKEMVQRKNALDGSALPGKLADCSERDPGLSELYIVEGNRPAGPPRWAGTPASRQSCP